LLSNTYFAKKLFLKTLFHIQSQEHAGKDQVLLLEIGRDYCCYALFDRDNKSINEIRYFSIEETDSANQLHTIIEQLGKEKYSSVVVASNYPQSLLVPREYFLNNFSLLETVYNQYFAQHLQDSIEDKDIINIFSIPQDVYDKLNSSFTSVQFVHSYSCFIRNNELESFENAILVQFTTTEFSVIYTKDGNVQLTQAFKYVSAPDVVYYLLKVCSAYGLSQEDVHLVLSGLLEKDSAMYLELQNYFLQLHFAGEPGLKLPESNHPHYFFTSIYNLAACA
jgi:hypothetical protein